jgi:hypothetical protein
MSSPDYAQKRFFASREMTAHRFITDFVYCQFLALCSTRRSSAVRLQSISQFSASFTKSWAFPEYRTATPYLFSASSGVT